MRDYEGGKWTKISEKLCLQDNICFQCTSEEFLEAQDFISFNWFVMNENLQNDAIRFGLMWDKAEKCTYMYVYKSS